MRLLLVTQDFPPHVGGIQTYCYELARRLASRCEAVHVVAPLAPGAREVDATLDFPVHRIATRTDFVAAVGAPTILRLCRRHRFDAVLHAQWMTTAPSLLARRLGWIGRVFVAAHGRELLLRPARHMPPAQAAYDRWRRIAFASADAVFAVSRYTAKLATDVGVVPQRIDVIPNGTDPQRFCPGPAAPFRERHGLGTGKVILTLGRLVARKGVDTLIRALPKVHQRVPDAVVVVAGDGPERASLQSLATTCKVADSVRFIGRVTDDDVVDAYRGSDVFVTVSRAIPPDVEGFGIVFLEANACGKPVIGARTGGIPDAIVDGETGLLVPPDDSDALAAGLLRVLEDAAVARRLGEAGRARVLSEFTWDHVADNLLARMRARCGHG